MDAREPESELSAGPGEYLRRAWPVGAVTALVVGTALLAVLVGFSPFGFDSSTLFEQPVFLAILLAMSAALGARLSWRATSGGWWQAISAGMILGLLWSPLAIVVLFVVALVDASGRGVFAASTISQDVAVLVYDMAIFSIYGAAFFLPLGVIWALATRGVDRIIGRVAGHGGTGRPPSTAGLVLALILISVGGGTAQALAYAPWSTRCFPLPGGTPTDAAFSPAGDLLVVALPGEAGAVGTVLLLDWPTGRTVAHWQALADEAVTVGPNGQVYWSSSDYNGEGPGIVSAVPGSAPTLLVGPDSTGLSELTWTSTGLVGITTDSQSVGRISLASSPSELTVEPGSGEIGELWASPDGAVLATQQWAGSTIDIRSPSGSVSVPIKGGALSFALSADLRTIVVAAATGGIRLVDIASGHSRRVMAGSQAFITVSERGDIAWANDEQFGRAQLCTSTLAQLDGG